MAGFANRIYFTACCRLEPGRGNRDLVPGNNKNYYDNTVITYPFCGRKVF
jgi:hypothetical protein